MSDYQNNSQQPQQVVVNVMGKKNGVGTAGFVLSLIAFFFGWVPILGWILWILGLILSFVGVFKTPKGLAIAGLVISLIDLIFLTVVFSLIAGAFA